MKRLEFSLPYDSEKIKIIGKSRYKHDSEKSGRELYNILWNSLPGGIYRSLERNMVADLLARSCDIKDLQSLKNKVHHQMKTGRPYVPKVLNFYNILEKAIEAKKQKENNVFYRE